MRSFAYILAVLWPVACWATDIVPDNKGTRATIGLNDVPSDQALIEFPQDSDWFRVVGTAGANYVVSFSSDLLDADYNTVAAGEVKILDANGRDLGYTTNCDDYSCYIKFINKNNFVAFSAEFYSWSSDPVAFPLSYNLHLNASCAHNFATQCTTKVGVVKHVRFYYSGDADWYKISLVKGKAYTMEGVDVIYNSASKMLATTAASKNRRSFRAPYTGSYFLGLTAPFVHNASGADRVFVVR